jgi:hypothetical protein
LIAALALLQSGCGSSGYRGPITTFQSAAAVMVASTRLYLTQLNRVERDKYIQEQLSIPDVIDLRELEKVQVFSPEGLSARLEALDQLARYGDLLSRLANSDAPARIKASAVDLSTATRNLSQTVSGLAGADDAKCGSLLPDEPHRKALDGKRRALDNRQLKLSKQVWDDTIQKYEDAAKDLGDVNKELAKTISEIEKIADTLDTLARFVAVVDRIINIVLPA